MLCNWQFANKQLPLGQRGECSRQKKMSSGHSKQQITFVRRRFARDKTQLTQGLTTPFDWKCRTRYSSSLVKITICSIITISEAEKKHQ